MGKIYQGDVGVEIRANVTVPLTDSTLTKYKVKKPSGVEATWSATVYDTTTLTYTTVAADLDEVGEYIVQAYVEWGATSKHLGESDRFVVAAKYD